jgi:hypothetical protein
LITTKLSWRTFKNSGLSADVKEDIKAYLKPAAFKKTCIQHEICWFFTTYTVLLFIFLKIYTKPAAQNQYIRQYD